ncbi:S8 family serine peptidase [Saccharibacillus sp. CPCC 101409]|uniref:S8 family serine peptidase n=1 Tax=Saccharibacillus sp. CPCC 101409 TaxID=3058041 RepID=UPI002673F86E|nr:S8 family serine peptidase [Saccharibacillus sp. CPCC 101409]MDO3408455.1 S8 family serine peptidase [Saccharibacillus sp. CPCC 101409]
MKKEHQFFRKVSGASLSLALVLGAAIPVASASAQSQKELVPYKLSKPSLSETANTGVMRSLAVQTVDPASIISPKLDTKSLHKVRAIVQLSGEPVAAAESSAEESGLRSFSSASAEQLVDTQQSSFVSRAAALGVDLQVNYQYNTVLNGLEVTVSAKDLTTLATIPGVVSIDENQTYYEIPIEQNAAAPGDNFEGSPLEQMGVDEAWAEGYTGKGLKVGVIDTGVDYLHPDLKDAYKGGYDSFEQDNDPYEEPPIEINGTSYAGTSHGTHVSGTIVGRGTNPTSDLVQKGVAYEADLYVYKVLGRNIETGRASGSSAQVIDGIEHAVKDGMDVINLSLGSDTNKDPNSPDAVAINNAVLSGVTAVIANGNAADEGPYYYSLGSPASSQLAISVGAVTSESNHYKGTFAVSVGEDAPDEEAPAKETPKEEAAPAPEEETAAPESGQETPSSDTDGAQTPEEAAAEAGIESGSPAESAEQSAAEEAAAEQPAAEQPAASEQPKAEAITPAASEEFGPYTTDLLAWKTGQDNFASLLGTEPNEAVYANLGTDADYDALEAAGIDVTGKVVVVSRGSLTFDAKVRGASAHGAKAIVIFNGNVKASNPNEADLSESIAGRNDPVGSLAFLGDSFDYVPYFDMSGTEGRALARTALEQDTPEFEITFGSDYPKEVVEGDKMASFSSRGPNGDDTLSIKPDLVAPGVNLLSSYPEYGKFIDGVSYDEAYARSSGTSMATPHVAGLALLVKQKHKDWTPFDVRAALANTADVIADEEGTPYDVYSQGAGRAYVADALHTPALLQAVEEIKILNTDLIEVPVTNYASSTSFGVVNADSGALTHKLQLKNTSGAPVQYAASVKWHTDVTSDPNGPTPTPDTSKIAVQLTGLGAGGAVSASAGQSTQFGLEIDPASDAAKGVYEGEVVLQASGQPELHLPFAVHIGDEKPATGFGIQDIELTNRIITPDGDGNRDTTDVSFTLSATNVNYVQIAVYGIDDQYIGLLGQIYDEDASGKLQILDPGRYTFEDLDNVYLDEDTGKIGRLPEGSYQLELMAVQLTPNGTIAKDQYGNPIQYKAYSSYRIAERRILLVEEAIAAFDKQAAIVNTTRIGPNVLKLTSTEEVKFQVTGSDHPNLINSKGALRALPKEPTVVNLEVTAYYKKNSRISESFTVPVTLYPGSGK